MAIDYLKTKIFNNTQAIENNNKEWEKYIKQTK